MKFRVVIIYQFKGSLGDSCGIFEGELNSKSLSEEESDTIASCIKVRSIFLGFSPIACIFGCGDLEALAPNGLEDIVGRVLASRDVEGPELLEWTLQWTLLSRESQLSD